MFISHRLATQYGFGLVEAPMALVIPSEREAALEFATRIDRQADALLAEGSSPRDLFDANQRAAELRDLAGRA
jgi:hypothetical protein